MKKIYLLTLLPILTFFCFFKNISTINYSGSWQAATPTSAFILDLNQNGSNQITGTHYSIEQNGNLMDCGVDSTDITITGTVTTSPPLVVTFISAYCKKPGTATITKISDNKIVWKITRAPQGDFYIPNIDTLTKF
jgi:hypothetical protein